MRRFFSAYEGTADKFQVFSALHIGVLVTICSLILCLFIFQKALSKRSDLWRFLIAGLLFIFECSYQVWLVSTGKWDLKTTFPIELCEITSLLAIIMLLTKSYFLFETVYFWGCLGSLLALIFPDLHGSYNHFRFWIFMLTHTMNLITLTLMIAIIGYKPTVKSIAISFIMMNIYMLLMGTINCLLGSNYYFYYVFRQPTPNTPGLLTNIESGFLKILILDGMTLFSFFICYLPFAVINGLKNYFLHHPLSR